ncbi:hypothetical protein GCM10010433_22070 [Streptomyces pulveraceus]
MLTRLKNRVLRDALIVCHDGLTGLPEAISTVWDKAMVQTCVTHLIRNSMKYVSYGDRKKAAVLKPIYAAATESEAPSALDELRDDYGKNHPGLIASWERAWEEFIPFPAFDREIRRVICTTNAIEPLNYQPRKIARRADASPPTTPSSSSTSASATLTPTTPSPRPRTRRRHPRLEARHEQLHALPRPPPPLTPARSPKISIPEPHQQGHTPLHTKELTTSADAEDGVSAPAPARVPLAPAEPAAGPNTPRSRTSRPRA